MANRSIVLTDLLYHYYSQISHREPAILQELRLATAELSAHQMQISPEQGQFMALLIQLMGAQRALEIGTYTGYSALAVALALPESGELVACDNDPVTTQLAFKYWQKAGVAEKIKLHIAPALQTLERLLQQGEAGNFDFCFIDADKANYANYYEKALLLVRKGGLIMLDNVLWGGQVSDPSNKQKRTQALRELNQQLHQDERISLCMIPMSDGITLARKR